MEVFAPGFKPRELQFAIVEQNPTLLNITLFPENNQRIEFNTNNLDDKATDDLLDKLDQVLDEEDYLDEDAEEVDDSDDKIFGIIPNPLAKLQKDIKSNVDSFFSKIPLIG